LFTILAPVHARRHRRGDPAAHTRGPIVKSGIHPDYVVTTVTCSCGSTFTTRSTAKNGVIHADVCSQCHPFYTGKQKILDVGGRVERFERRDGKREKTGKSFSGRRPPRGPGVGRRLSCPRRS
jgi:large subunit ribosomal protein L31